MRESAGALLLSIHPEYAGAIFSGTKKIELRRKRPRISQGSRVLVYETAPTMALVGAFEVAGVLKGAPANLWAKVRTGAGVTRECFNEYFSGMPEAFAIEVSEAWLYPEPVSLQRLRKILPGFHPPQGFRYLHRCEMERAGIPLRKPARLRLT